MGGGLECDDLEPYAKEVYFIKIAGTHNPISVDGSSTGCANRLGICMEKLWWMLSKEHGRQAESEDLMKATLREIETKRNLEEGSLDSQLHIFLELLKNQKQNIEKSNRKWHSMFTGLSQIGPLDDTTRHYWGSERQLKFGKVVVDTLAHTFPDSWGNLDPIFGALLCPTGGIVGPGNSECFKRKKSNDALVAHAIFHDAGGFLYNYHHRGPGYDYVRRWSTFLPRFSALSNQLGGYYFWQAKIEKWQEGRNSEQSEKRNSEQSEESENREPVSSEIGSG